jgi:hypothetical protein
VCLSLSLSLSLSVCVSDPTTPPLPRLPFSWLPALLLVLARGWCWPYFLFFISKFFLSQRLVLALSTSFAIRGESRERIASRAVAAALGGGGGVWEEGDAYEGGGGRLVSILAGGRLQGLGTNISSYRLGTCLFRLDTVKSDLFCAKRDLLCMCAASRSLASCACRSLSISLSFHLLLSFSK